MSASDVSLRITVEKIKRDLRSLETQIKHSLDGLTSTATPFDTVADMLVSDPATWHQAECANYFPGDDILSIWIKTSDPSRLPNGTDVLQTYGPTNPGVNLVRVYVRESDGGVVVPVAGLSSYTVTVPVAVESISDFRNSLFDTDLVWVTDPARPMAFKKGNLTTDDDGVNGLTNAAGVHYDRMRFE